MLHVAWFEIVRMSERFFVAPLTNTNFFQKKIYIKNKTKYN